MLYNKGNHAQLKRVQPQPSRLQGENGGKIYSTWNPGMTKFQPKICIKPARTACEIQHGFWECEGYNLLLLV